VRIIRPAVVAREEGGVSRELGAGPKRAHPRPGPSRSVPTSPPRASPARLRFQEGDSYRAGREWQRYEGTAQRDLFRELRERFVARHRPVVPWALDAGSGPGRFTRGLGGGPAVRRVAIDIGPEMLRQLGERWPAIAPGEAPPNRVRANAVRSPFAAGSFGVVAALGNLLGFAESDSGRLLDELLRLVAPGGTLLLEVAPGPGERSRYLHRLPPTSVARLFRSGPGLVAGRISREGFVTEPRRRAAPGEFRRLTAASLAARLASAGWTLTEVRAVAPALGPDALRAAAVARDPKAWGNLLDVEERLGSSAARWPDAAAVLIAATAPSVPPLGGGGPRSESEG
jgi:SAM-dependent methyltransferase